MSLRTALRVINEMETEGVVDRYAVAGAVAAFNYIEPALTQDLDVLVSFEGESTKRSSGIVSLGPILTWLASRGYDRVEAEGVDVGGWPIQFLPVASSLDEEALRDARSVELKASATEEAVQVRIMSPEHLMATALAVGRPKDDLRLVQFLQSNAFDRSRLQRIITAHDLAGRWDDFCRRLRVRDPLADAQMGGN